MYTCSRIHSHPSYKYFPQAWVVVEGVEGKKRWVSKYANLIHFNKVYTTVWAKCHVAHRKERRWRQGRVWERLKRTYILQRSCRLSRSVYTPTALQAEETVFQVSLGSMREKERKYGWSCTVRISWRQCMKALLPALQEILNWWSTEVAHTCVI